MYCDKKQLPTLPFYGPHPKPHGTRGLSKHHHLRFDTKLGHVICKIFRVPFACIATLKNNTKIDRKIIYVGKLVVKAKHLFSMQENTHCYW